LSIDKLWDYSDPAGSESRLRDAAVAAGDESSRLELLTQVARAQGLQHRFAEAHATLDGVKPKLDGASAGARVRYLLERGRVYNSSGAPEQARPLFVEAWDGARQAGLDNLAVDAAHMLAIIETGEAAVAWNERAMALAESSCDASTRRWLGPLYNNLGWTWHDRGDLERALELFEKAQAWHETHGNGRTQLIARWSVARTLRSIGRIEEALAIQRQLLAECELAGSPDGFVYEELAECLLRLERINEAGEYFALAFAELSRDARLARDEPQRLARLKSLARQ
jgi:tetratricopeptide (TPR) repeat protein